MEISYINQNVNSIHRPAACGKTNPGLETFFRRNYSLHTVNGYDKNARTMK